MLLMFKEFVYLSLFLLFSVLFNLLMLLLTIFHIS